MSDLFRGNCFPASASPLSHRNSIWEPFFPLPLSLWFLRQKPSGTRLLWSPEGGPGDHLKGDFRFPGLRRLCFRRFCHVRMPSGDLIFPECGAREYDEGRKPLYHCHRGRCMLLAGSCHRRNFFPDPSLESVLGGCTIMMFGTIMVSGIQMLSRTDLPSGT